MVFIFADMALVRITHEVYAESFGLNNFRACDCISYKNRLRKEMTPCCYAQPWMLALLWEIRAHHFFVWSIMLFAWISFLICIFNVEILTCSKLFACSFLVSNFSFSPPPSWSSSILNKRLHFCSILKASGPCFLFADSIRGKFGCFNPHESDCTSETKPCFLLSSEFPLLILKSLKFWSSEIVAGLLEDQFVLNLCKPPLGKIIECSFAFLPLSDALLDCVFVSNLFYLNLTIVYNRCLNRDSSAYHPFNRSESFVSKDKSPCERLSLSLNKRTEYICRGKMK